MCWTTVKLLPKHLLFNLFFSYIHVRPDSQREWRREKEDEGTAYMGSMAIVGAHGQAMTFAYIPQYIVRPRVCLTVPLSSMSPQQQTRCWSGASFGF